MARRVRISGVPQAQKSLRAAYTRVFPKRGGPVLFGLQRGATIFIRKWRGEVERQVQESQAAGSRYSPTGLMRKSIKRYRMRRPARVGATEAIRITVDPSAVYENGMRVAAVAGILEHGRSDMPAKALVRKAFDSGREEAAQAVYAGIITAMERVLKKL